MPGLRPLFAPSYDAVRLLAPALTAKAMGLLVDELTHHPGVSLWAGCVVAFSSYEVSHMPAHLNLTFGVGAASARRAGLSMPWGLVAGLAAPLVGQFLISTTVLASMTLFGEGSWVLA